MEMIPVCNGRGLALMDAFSDWQVTDDNIELCKRTGAEPRNGILFLLHGEDDLLFPGICYQGDDFAQVAISFEIRHPGTGEWREIDLTSLPHSIPELERNRAENGGGIGVKPLRRD